MGLVVSIDMRYLFVLLALIWASFVTAQSAYPIVKWSTFQAGTMAKIKRYETRVISTEGSWQSYWVTLTGNPASTAPKGLEWAREELWVIALGERTTGGCNLYVRSISFVDPRNVNVEFVETTQPAGSHTIQVVTSPYVVLRVERNGGVPRFVRCEDPGFNMGGSTVLLPTYNDDPIRPLRWGLLDRGTGSKISGDRIFNLATQREFENYARSAFPNNSWMQELSREVAWRDEMVVAIHCGTRARFTSVEIDRATVDQNGRVTISWFENTPSDGALTRCNPYLLMRIPRYSTSPTMRKTYGRS